MAGAGAGAGATVGTPTADDAGVGATVGTATVTDVVGATAGAPTAVTGTSTEEKLFLVATKLSGNVVAIGIACYLLMPAACCLLEPVACCLLLMGCPHSRTQLQTPLALRPPRKLPPETRLVAALLPLAVVKPAAAPQEHVGAPQEPPAGSLERLGTDSVPQPVAPQSLQWPRPSHCHPATR